MGRGNCSGSLEPLRRELKYSCITRLFTKSSPLGRFFLMPLIGDKDMKLNLILAASAMVTSLAVAPVAQAQEPTLGEIRLFGTNFCPRGWSEAAGQMLPINQNQSLYSLYGTMYGGDGRTSFALPDLRGRTPVDALGQAAPRTSSSRYSTMRYCVAVQGLYPSRN